MANLCIARRGVVIKQRLGRDQYARDAISAWHGPRRRRSPARGGRRRDLLVMRLTSTSSRSDVEDPGSRNDLSYYRRYSARNNSAARSPIMTQGAMVLPVVTRGIIDPSAIRRRSM